jgi:subtilisin-like proprotein convertase family protein
MRGVRACGLVALAMMAMATTGCSDGGGDEAGTEGEGERSACEVNNGGCGDPAFFICTNTRGPTPSCTDIDECGINNGACGDPTFFSCDNNIGSAPTCGDIDECAADNGGCGNPVFFSCANNIGAPPSCADIDECAADNGGCGNPVFFSCANNIGAPPSCADIDECAVENGGCGDPVFFSCANNIGAPPSCADIDECAVENGGCGDPTFFLCINNVGAAPSCTDVDECATDNGGCGSAILFTCTNTIGGTAACGLTDAGLAAAACERFEVCGPPDPTCEELTLGQLQGPDAAPDDPLCAAMNTAIETFYRCNLNPALDACDPNVCQAERTVVDELFNQGAGPCLDGQPSVLSAPDWLCPTSYFGDGDCDCGCGDFDADCGGAGGCAAPGCAGLEPAGETSTCSFCFVDAAAATEGAAIPCVPTITAVAEQLSGRDASCADPAFPILVQWTISGTTPRPITTIRVTIPGAITSFDDSFAVTSSGTISETYSLCFPENYSTVFADRDITFSLIDIEGGISEPASALPLPPLLCEQNDLLFRIRADDLVNGLQIPDNTPTGATSLISFSNTGLAASKVAIFINQLQHSFVGDLTLQLLVGDQSRTLIESIGGTGDNLIKTVFDDGCTPSISAASAPFTGCFTPLQELGVLAGTPVDNEWSLRVIDNTPDDVGTLIDWMLGLCIRFDE